MMDMKPQYNPPRYPPRSPVPNVHFTLGPNGLGQMIPACGSALIPVESFHWTYGKEFITCERCRKIHCAEDAK